MSGTIIEQRVLKRHLSAEEKLKIVQKSNEPGVLVAEVARQYNVGLSSLIKWRKYAMEGSLMSIKDKQPSVPSSEVKKLKREIKQLQRLLGKKSLQIDLLQDAIEIAREKKLISRHPLPGVEDIAND